MSLPAVLSVEAVATYLGFAEATVRAMLRRGEIPGVRFAGKWRIRESALVKLFERQESLRADVEAHAVRVLRGVRHSRRRAAIVVPPKCPLAPNDGEV